MALDPQSTRLFPKGLGADRYHISGIAARCDWVVLSDRTAPQVHLHRNVDTDTPRHIFLSLRQPFVALRHFTQKILPGLTRPFVLISGSEDVTVPNQIDERWRRFDDTERGMIAELLNHPLLVHWVAENLDEARSPKLSPMPLGMVFPDGRGTPVAIPDVPPLRARPGCILCAHRIRAGARWETRRKVTRLARQVWAGWCTVIEEEVDESAYATLLRQHRFVLCVEGGGLDPAPKAWQAILNGCIPIVRTSPLQPAYAELPVAFVADWSPEALGFDRLRAFLRDIEARFGHDRAGVIDRLGIEHWWQKIRAQLPDHPAP